MRRNLYRTALTAPLLLAAAAYTAGGGYVHLREWWNLYRHLPSSVAGSAVVKIGFPVNAAVSLVVASLLCLAAARGGRRTGYIVGASLLFQASSLAVLILTRTGSVLGWSERTWSLAANQARLAEVAALGCLALVIAIAFARRRSSPPAVVASSDLLPQPV